MKNKANKKTKPKYMVRGFSLPTELMEWLPVQAKADGVTSVSNFLALIVAREKKFRENSK